MFNRQHHPSLEVSSSCKTEALSPLNTTRRPPATGTDHSTFCQLQGPHRDGIAHRFCFCDQRISFTTTSSRPGHVGAHVRLSLLFEAEERSPVWTGHMWFARRLLVDVGLPPPLGCCAHISLRLCSQFFGVCTQRWNCGVVRDSTFNILRNIYTVFRGLHRHSHPPCTGVPILPHPHQTCF